MKKTFEFDQTKYDQNAPTRTEQFLTANGVKTLTTDANDGAVLIQDSVDPDSLNPVTAAAVATAVAGASGEVPVIGNSDNGKVLKAVVDGDDKHVEWGEVESGSSYTAGDGISITNDTISAKVDGTTVTVNLDGELESHAVGNQVPAVTSSDNAKVLTASYAGGVGSYAWSTPSAASSVELIKVSDVPTRFSSIDDIVTSLSQGNYIVLYYTTGTTVYRYYVPYSCDLRSNGTREMYFVSTPDANAKYSSYSSNATYWVRLYQSGEGQPITASNNSDSLIKLRPELALSDMLTSGRLTLGWTYNVGDIVGGPKSSSDSDWVFYKCTSTFTAASAAYIYNDTTHWVQVKLADEIQRRVPGIASTDSGKVLTVNSSLQAEWMTPSASSAPLVITYDASATTSQINSIGDSIRAALQANQPIYLRVSSDPLSPNDIELMIPLSQYVQPSVGTDQFEARFTTSVLSSDGQAMSIYNYSIQWGTAASATPGWLYSTHSMFFD